MDKFIKNLIEGNNFPPKGSVAFTSSDHVRFQNNQDISGHNYGANRRLVIEKILKMEKDIPSLCLT